MSEQHIFENGYRLGQIYLPDGTWADVNQPLTPGYGGDVWSDPKSVIEHPLYEQLYARVHNSIVSAGYCGDSGSGRFGFVQMNFQDCAEGDVFDYDRKFIDREVIERKDGKEITFCSYFGREPRRTMHRVRERAETPSSRLLQDRVLDRMCRYSIAIKVFLARAGFPEFCKRSVPRGYLDLLENYRRREF